MTRKLVVSILAVYLFTCAGIGIARSANQPRYDRFLSHRSGNVVRIPARCWAEDSLGHLYVSDIADHGATVTFHCHHKGY